MFSIFQSKKLRSIFSKDKTVLVGISLFVALAVLLFLLYINVGFLSIVGYFERHDMYKDSVVLFFHRECSYCDKVDTYLRDYKVQEKIDFVRLDVFDNNYNENELTSRARACGLDINEIGVPFLWDGPEKKCVIGYVDIISFFRKKMAQKP